jgi:ATP/maltotriose-dependent transcriptional regulator MalT
LRFTLTEAAEFLNQVMGLTLSPAEIAALEARTEGWAAGLQMAAISMQGRTDVTVRFHQAVHRAATALSLIIWPRRFCSARANRCAVFWCRPPFWPA